MQFIEALNAIAASGHIHIKTLCQMLESKIGILEHRVWRQQIKTQVVKMGVVRRRLTEFQLQWQELMRDFGDNRFHACFL
jgi:hypothetical protein